MSEQRQTVELTVSGILNDLKEGLTRDDIAEKYGLTKSDVKRVFQHPKLKNRKTIKPRAFVLVDDAIEATQEAPVEDSGSTEGITEAPVEYFGSTEGNTEETTSDATKEVVMEESTDGTPVEETVEDKVFESNGAFDD